MNYYRRYLSDYLRDTARLTMLEHGAYNLLLDYYYMDEKPLPLDHSEIYMLVRAMRTEDQRATDKVLGLFFQKEADGYHQKRVDEEIRVAQATIAKQRLSGAESAAKRWGKDGSTDGSIDRLTDTGGDGLTIPSDDTTTQPLNHSTTHPPKRAETRGTRLPSDWRPTPEQVEWAKKARGWTEAHVLSVGETFRDHWIAQPGKDGVKLDWPATWRNWVRRENNKSRRNDGPRGTLVL